MKIISPAVSGAAVLSWLRHQFPARALVAVLWLSFVPGLEAAPPGSGWRLVWSDEFTGAANAAPDTSKWGYGQLPWGGNFHNSSYASVIQAADSYLDGSGHLVLRCRAGTFAGSDGNNHPTSEGMVYSNGKLDYTYGYVEINAQYPNNSAASLWPAFWLNSSGSWPPEFDIAEYWSYGNYMHLAFAWNSGGTQWDTTTVSGEDVGSAYHTYGLDWQAGHAAWFKDGVNRKQIDSANVANSAMYVILNSGTASSPGPNTSGANFPNYYYVDYLRLWKRSEYLYNNEFEAWNGGWSTRNGASAVSGQGIDGGIAMRIATSAAGNGVVEQTVYGLWPNTDYVLTGWGRNDTNSWWPAVRIGIRNYGGADTNRLAGSNPAWNQASLPFTTGPITTNATIYAYVPESWGTVYTDELLLRRAATVNNPGFESSFLDPWWEKAGNSWLLKTSARGGSYAQQFHSNSSAWQTLAGLRPGTTYNLKVWVTGPSWPGLQVSVTNSGGANASMTVTPSGSYKRGILSFTTGATSTTATLALGNSPQGSDYVYFADDLFLAEPLNAPWQGQDIGTVVLEGASGRRGSQFAVEGAGADIWGTNDAFHFVSQTLVGDGQITARIRTQQNTDPSAKCGVMMRETLTAGARHMLVDWLPQSVVETLWRTVPNGTTTAAWNTNVTLAPWVRLQRVGNVFTGFYSLNGSSWIQTAQQTLPMANSIYVGLAVCSHDTAEMSEVIFDDVSLTCTVSATPLVNQTNCPGAGVTFSTTASGTGPFSYLWRKNGSVLAGKATNSLTLSSITAADAATYSVEVTGACGSATNNAYLAVMTPVTATPLVSQTNCPGANVTFSTTASGTGPFSYVWRKNNGVLSGKTTNYLTLTGITAADAATYSVEVNGACGSVTNSASLAVNAPVTATPLADQSVSVGDTVAWSTTAGGSGPFGYAWTKDGAALAGQLGSSLTLMNVSTDAAGIYGVQVSGACGTVTNVATLTVNPPSLMAVLTGDELTLLWPTGAAGYMLEVSPELGAPSGWVQVGATPSVVNGSSFVTLPASNAASFFRLRK